MTTVTAALDARQPLVAVVCRAPLVCEGLARAFDGVAVLRSFGPGIEDVADLLAWLEPDAVVVDTGDAAGAAVAFARERDAPLVHLDVDEPRIRAYVAGRWTELEGDPVPELVRNIVVGTLYRPGRKP